jgi:glyoxylase-like metal-dependent hydrolase (beta-lactamase superfamily II)
LVITGRRFQHGKSGWVTHPSNAYTVFAGAHDDTGHLIFANAHYFIGQAEWNYWMSDAAADSAIPMAALVRRNLAPLRGRITLIEHGHEIVPGMRAIATPGHTAGHMALPITAGREELLHVSDVVLFPLHLEHPDWLPVFDLSPARAAASKQSIFDYAAEQQALVFAHHFPPFPDLGHVIKQAVGWQWQPIMSDGG